MEVIATNTSNAEAPGAIEDTRKHLEGNTAESQVGSNIKLVKLDAQGTAVVEMWQVNERKENNSPCRYSS